MLFHHVDDEESRRQTGQISDRTKVLLQFGTLTVDLQNLTLGEVRECTVVHHLVDVRHFLHGLADSREVGEHTARPTLDDVRHVDRGSLFGYDVLSLFFSSDEQDLLAALGNSLECLSSLVDLGYSLVEVDDVNAIALHEDVRSHSWIPLAFEVAEMAASLK